MTKKRSRLKSSRNEGSPSIMEIKFYRANEKPYGAFSNLFKRPILFEGRLFPTAEHAYQAGKARKKEVKEWILSAPSPSLVAMAAHGLYSWDVTPEWARLKFERMKNVLRQKFTQHHDLRQLLISTGNARLVEVGRTNSLVNRTWGEVNGKGENKLGMLLMELRQEFQSTNVAKRKHSSRTIETKRSLSTALIRRNSTPA